MNADRLGDILKGPLQLSVDITNRCNLHCLHCFNRSGENVENRLEQELTEAELLKLAIDIKEMQPQSLCLCGGEPLLRKDTTIAFLRCLKNEHIHPSMVTNGFFLDKITANLLKSVGLESIQISIDGADAATHDRMRGVVGSYSHAMKALQIACNTGYKACSVAFSPTLFNFHQFHIVVEQVSQFHINELRVQPLMKLGRAASSPDIFLRPCDYRDLVHDIVNARLRHPEIRFEWGDPIDHLIRFSRGLDFSPYISIRANGDICLSSYLPFVIGNIRKHTLKEYWNAHIWGVWQVPLFKALSSFYKSTADFYREDVPFPSVYSGKSIVFDLIDDRLFSLSTEEVNRLYWKRVPSRKVSICFNEEKDLIEKIVKRKNLRDGYYKMGKHLPMLSPTEIKERVDSVILGSKSKEINSNGAESFLYGLQHNGLHYEICSECALFNIEKFLNSFLIDHDSNAENKLIMSPYVSPRFDVKMLNRLFLRMKLFNYSYHFFVVKDNNKQIIAMGLVNAESGLSSEPQTQSIAASLELLIVTKNDQGIGVVSNLLRFLVCNLWRSVVVAVPKIHVIMTRTQEKMLRSFVRLLKNERFFCENSFKDKNIKLYSRFLS